MNYYCSWQAGGVPVKHKLVEVRNGCIVINKTKLHVWPFVTQWTVGSSRLLSVGFPDKHTRMGSHVLLLGNLPDPGIKPGSPALQADSLLSEPPRKPDVVLKLMGDIIKFGIVEFRKFRFWVLVWDQIVKGYLTPFCMPELWLLHYDFNLSSSSTQDRNQYDL